MTVHVANLVQASAVMLAWTAERSQDYPIVLRCKVMYFRAEKQLFLPENAEKSIIALCHREQSPFLDREAWAENDLAFGLNLMQNAIKREHFIQIMQPGCSRPPKPP